MRYVSFIHRDGAGYGVSFPDFPGCVSVGNTVDDAVRHGSEALAFHVEGLVATGTRYRSHARSTPSRPTRNLRIGGARPTWC